MRRGLSSCPSCGSPVSQFAAGCAICGYDLAAARRERAARRRFELPALRRPGWLGDELWVAAVVGLIVVFMPVVGVLLAGFVGANADREGRVAVRNVAIGAAVLGIALFLVPAWRYGIFTLLD